MLAGPDPPQHRLRFHTRAVQREQLRQLRRDTGIRYDFDTRGILHLYEDGDEFEHARKQAELLRARGLDIEIRRRKGAS